VGFQPFFSYAWDLWYATTDNPPADQLDGRSWIVRIVARDGEHTGLNTGCHRGEAHDQLKLGVGVEPVAPRGTQAERSSVLKDSERFSIVNQEVGNVQWNTSGIAHRERQIARRTNRYFTEIELSGFDDYARKTYPTAPQVDDNSWVTRIVARNRQHPGLITWPRGAEFHGQFFSSGAGVEGEVTLGLDAESSIVDRYGGTSQFSGSGIGHLNLRAD